MRDPLFSQDNVSSPSLAKKQKNFIGMIFNLYRLIVPQKLEQDSELKEIALACAVRDLRKIYFYDAVHNVVLFVATTSVLVFFFEVDISPTWLIISLILGIFFYRVALRSWAS
jgi:hypothetical protein